jgi:hypothetical protein
MIFNVKGNEEKYITFSIKMKVYSYGAVRRKSSLRGA